MKRIISVILCIALFATFMPVAFAEEADNVPVITKQPSDIHMSYEESNMGKRVNIDIEAYVPNGDEVYYEIYLIVDGSQALWGRDISNFLPCFSYKEGYEENIYFVRVYDKDEYGNYVDSDMFKISHAKINIKERIKFYSAYTGYATIMLTVMIFGVILFPYNTIVYEIEKLFSKKH